MCCSKVKIINYLRDYIPILNKQGLLQQRKIILKYIFGVMIDPADLLILFLGVGLCLTMAGS